MSKARAVAQHLPYLRRYARALTGSQASGDAYVAATLEALVKEPQLLESEELPRVTLFRLFSAIWNSLAVNGTVDFFVSHHHHASSLHADWAKAGHGTEPEKITVPVITLDSYFGDTRKTWPDLIKMDIEGGGTFALPGAARCFAEKRPFLLIESHTPDEDRAVSHILLHNDYQAYRLNTRKWVEDRLDTTPNPQSVGVWGTMFLCPTEKQREVAARI
jgi:FkbM family methyltransferase